MSTTNPPGSRSDDDQGDRGREPPREDDAQYFVVRELKLCTGCNRRHVGPGHARSDPTRKSRPDRCRSRSSRRSKKIPIVLSPRDQSNVNIGRLMGEFRQLRNDFGNLKSRVDAALGNIAPHHNEVFHRSQSTRATGNPPSIDVYRVRRLLMHASFLIHFAHMATFPRPAADEATNNNVQGQMMGSAPTSPQLRSQESDSSGSRDCASLLRGTSAVSEYLEEPEDSEEGLKSMQELFNEARAKRLRTSKKSS